MRFTEDLRTGLPHSSAEAAERIATFTRDLIAEALTVRALAGTLKGAKKLIEDASREYAERFLFELIQNAYDAQPPGSRGRVLVRLDATEGEFGCMYVANTGRPFTHANFQAICEIAQSSRHPGEGIGNKGIGFKSVLQVAAWPQIYSSSTSGPVFEGYCFRFAEPNDMARLTSTPAEAETLADRLSPYGLPIHIDRQDRPAVLERLASEGLVTVVRLPLRTEAAAQIARTQIEQVKSPVAPIHLFLDRLAALRIEIEERDGTRTVTELQREEHPTAAQVDGIEIYEVELGVGQRYLCLSKHVERASFLAAIEASIAATLVDKSWRDWQGEPVVSVAVPLGDAGDGDSRLYCFLPMGPAANGPIAGHVNAPFAVSLARDGLIRGAPLNDFLLDTAADIVAAAVPALGGHPAGRAAVVDLIGWEEPHTCRLVDAFVRAGSSVPTAPIVPVLGKPGWSSLADAFTWTRPMRVLTPEAISATGLARIVDPVLGTPRLDRLDRLANAAASRSLAPGFTPIAAWAEAIALSLAAAARRNGNLHGEAWIRLYDDLAEIFGRHDVSALRGRRILVDDEMRVHPTWGGASTDGSPAIFFPMREIADGDDASRDVSIPKTLGRHLAYLHRDIPWRSRNPETKRIENRPGRDFLDRTGLVRMPRTQSLLERISVVLRRSKNKQMHADALKLVFNLTGVRSYSQTPAVSDLNLRVPTVSGQWRPADEAVFSASWPGTLGESLEALIDDAAGVSEDLEALRGHLLGSPAEFGFRLGPLAAWVSFLRQVGVRDGLPPIEVSPEVGDKQGWWWTQFFPRTVPMPEADHARWDPVVTGSNCRPSYPYTDYRLTGGVFRLPASGEYESLPQRAREMYGRLVVEGLAVWPDNVLTTSIARPRYGNAADPVAFSSPVTTFLRGASWVPVTRPSAAGVEDFARPDATWHYRDTDNEARPTFMPLVVTPVRGRIETSSIAADRLRDLGLNVWNDRRDSVRRLRALAHAYQRLDVADTLVANFRKAYERTWTLVTAAAGPAPVDRLGPEDELVVTRRGRVEVHSLGDPIVPYVLVDEDRLVAAILDTIEVPVLPIDPKDGPATAAFVLEGSGVALRTIGAADIRVFVDGEPVAITAGVPLILPDREWIVDLVALTLEFKASAFNRQTDQRVRAAIEVLRGLRLHAGVDVAIELGGTAVTLPTHMRRIFAIAAPGQPAIAYEGDVDGLDWDTLAALARRSANCWGPRRPQTPSRPSWSRSLAGLGRPRSPPRPTPTTRRSSRNPSNASQRSGARIVVGSLASPTSCVRSSRRYWVRTFSRVS